jgi:hypothetical protein
VGQWDWLSIQVEKCFLEKGDVFFDIIGVVNLDTFESVLCECQCWWCYERAPQSSDAISVDEGLIDKIVEVLGTDEVHDGEESLAVMCILEKVIFGD